MPLIIVTGSILVLVGCSDGHVWWFLLPDYANFIDIIANNEGGQAKESENLSNDRNTNISRTFSGKESYEQAIKINATSFGKFASQIDDLVCLDLYPDVIYSSCITRTISGDKNGYNMNDGKKSDARGGDGRIENNTNDQRNVLLNNASVSGKHNPDAKSDSDSGALLSTHICIVSSGRLRIIGVCRVCDIIVGDEHTLSAHLFYDSNLSYHSRGEYVNGNFLDNSVMTRTTKHGYQYAGCYGDVVKQDKYGNYAFITVQDGVLYSSILTPFRSKSLSGGNPIRNTDYESGNDNSENSELSNDRWYNSDAKVFLSQPHRLTSETCPFIYYCNILSHRDEVEVERSLKERDGEKIDASHDESSATNMKDMDMNINKVKEKCVNGSKNDHENDDKNKCPNKSPPDGVIKTRNGLKLHFIDDTTGGMKTQFLPHKLQSSDGNQEDVLCVLRSMCGYQAISNYISTSSPTISKSSSSVQKNSGDVGYKGATGSGNPKNDLHNLIDSSNRYRNSNRKNINTSNCYTRSGHSAHLDIHRITSALDTAVETEKILAKEIQTVDLEILQLVSLISLIENDALSSKYVNYICVHSLVYSICSFVLKTSCMHTFISVCNSFPCFFSTAICHIRTTSHGDPITR